jgi:iron complex outermembrane recepter protein
VKQKVLVSAIKKIVGAELLLSAAFAPAAFAQSAPAAPASDATPAVSAAAPAAASDAGTTKLQRVEVTGSLIRSSDKTGYNQVQTITAKDIESSGETNVADYLRSLTANSASSWSEGQVGGFAAGAAGIALRGLSEKYTLVLVDGQRVASYAFSSNITDQFFDLNTLPLNIVDRIEIVKTGAVSQYGSDAIAGVVNIITKKDVHGLTLDASLGGAQQGGSGTTQFSALGGFGNLNSDRYNITAAASYYNDNGFDLAQRDTTRGMNFSNSAGGSFVQPSSFFLPTGGNEMALCGGAARQTVNPASLPSPGTAGTVCSTNTATNTSIEPQTERLSGKVHGTFKIDDNTQAFVDVWAARNDSTTKLGAATFNSGSSTFFNPGTGELNNLANGGIVPVSNPNNPFGVPGTLRYVFPNETYATDTVENFLRVSTGVKGSFTLPHLGDWDWSASLGHSQDEVNNTLSNVINVGALNNLLQNGGFNFANPAATPNGTAGLFGTAGTDAMSKLETVDLTASTPDLFTLPTGDVGLGLGAEFTHQSENIDSNAGFVLPGNSQTVNGERNVYAVYYEFDIPIIKNLTFNQSGRYDHYSDFGGAFSPRFALRYQPIQAFTAYASYSRGFRAPTLVENSQSSTVSTQSATDPFDPQNSTVPQAITEVTRGNPALQPERTHNYNLGFQLSPTPTTDIGFDWYRIDITNVVAEVGADVQTLLDNNDPTVVVRNADGSVNHVNFTYGNVAYLNTDGFETTFHQALPTKFGTFNFSADWAYVWHFSTPGSGSASNDIAGNNGGLFLSFGGAFPRWKGNTSLSWDYAKFTTSLTWQYTGPYTDVVNGTGSIGSYNTFNLFVTYNGFKNWSLYAGIDNLTNRAPPFDPAFEGSPSFNGYDESLYNYVGRFAQIGATYHFK